MRTSTNVPWVSWATWKRSQAPAWRVEVLEEAEDVGRLRRGKRLDDVPSDAGRGSGDGHVRQLGAGHDVVEVIEEPREVRRARVPGPGQRVLHDGADAPRVRGQHDDAVGHVGHLPDVVADHEDRAGVALAVVPDVQHLRAEGLGGQRVHLAEGLVHEQDLGVDRQRAGHAHPLLHAAGQLARVGLAKAFEPDHADGAARLLAGRGLVEAQRSQDHRHVPLDGQPGEEREALEDDGDPRIDALERRPVVEDLAAAGADQAGHDAEDRGLAATGGTEKGQDLVGPHVERDVLEHAKRLAALPLEGLVDPLQLADRALSHRFASLRQGETRGREPIAAPPHEPVERRRRSGT